MKFFRKRPYILFILPGLILYTIFSVYPMIDSIRYSFYEWSGIGPMKFIGLQNYYKLLFDPRTSAMFLSAFLNNMKYIFWTLLVITPIQVLFAYLIYTKIRGYKIFQMLILMPWVIGNVITSFFFMMMFNGQIGLINNILQTLHLQKFQQDWFGNPKYSFIVLIIAVTWSGVGYGMILFVANMRDISESIIEAALVDGAGALKRFTSIILPLMWPSITNVIVLDTIWGLTVFDLPYMIAGANGGATGSLDFMSTFFFRYAFGSSLNGDAAFGFGAAVSVVMFVMILSVTLIQSKLLKKLEI
ncbi:sugar ABC transporter permease [Clostridium estertheticum]|uniref:Sugar ABC transporter permease n=1 Tax=Clostridium estertheticum TaxID=238834 RepID=A0AA47EII0_9CLOT|nr:sugar ABC transporter permease [Clostridium estertheticum]MBU3157761.1 sugar ABC transporter permease [Clostridium estertheticum]MBU3201332.1 sugar ABC transporter permease [Clostridium estertheticum]WAG59283.1 sugar ABC transporter permease [Clostridium estertheticum]WAG66663.1 sugar ABC transporter permease [Clostridium estertheticum]